MGAVTAAVIGAAGAVAGGVMQNRAAGRAADAQRDAANAGIAEQRAAREQMQQNIAPYMQFGQTEGLGRLTQLLNDPNSIQQTPAYQFRFGQGLQALDRSAAARGGLFSGGHSVDLTNYGQNAGSQEYENQFSRLMDVARLGQNSAVGAGSMGMQSANAISGLYGNIGQAQAGGAINSANAWGNALSGLAGVAGQYMGTRQSAYQQPQVQQAPFQPNYSTAMSGQNNSLINKPFNFATWG